MKNSLNMQATKAYVENRGKNNAESSEIVAGDTEVETSTEKITVENSSGNPFSEE